MRQTHEHQARERIDDALHEQAGLAYAAATVARADAQRDANVELPASLRAKLEADAETYFARPVVAAEMRRQRRVGFVGGMLAAACAGLLVYGVSEVWEGLLGGERTYSDLVYRVPPGMPLKIDAPPVRLSFSGIESGYEGVSGQLLWSAATQAGEMTFEGLPPNDPKAGQYQLWIVDPARGTYPVDGGVFDVPAAEAGRAVTIPFTPKLPIENATMFAVTYEKPGGVVVSDGPLLITAKPS